MERTQHTVQNILIEVEGDRASSESYFVVYLRLKHEKDLADIIGAGRYVDHFERRDGVWKIKHRQVIYDWDRLEKVTTHFGETPGIPPQNPNGITLRGQRDKGDYSYKALKSIFQ
jgi:hypothetical protein